MMMALVFFCQLGSLEWEEWLKKTDIKFDRMTWPCLLLYSVFSLSEKSGGWWLMVWCRGNIWVHVKSSWAWASCEEYFSTSVKTMMRNDHQCVQHTRLQLTTKKIVITFEVKPSKPICICSHLAICVQEGKFQLKSVNVQLFPIYIYVRIISSEPIWWGWWW